MLCSCIVGGEGGGSRCRYRIELCERMCHSLIVQVVMPVVIGVRSTQHSPARAHETQREKRIALGRWGYTCVIGAGEKHGSHCWLCSNSQRDEVEEGALGEENTIDDDREKIIISNTIEWSLTVVSTMGDWVLQVTCGCTEVLYCTEVI